MPMKLLLSSTYLVRVVVNIINTILTIPCHLDIFYNFHEFINLKMMVDI